MARLSQKQRDETFARNTHGYFQAAADAKSDREIVLDDAYRRTDPSYVPDTVGHPKVKSPYLFSVLNTKKSWLIRALKANGVWVLANTLPEYETAGLTVTKAINAQFLNRQLDKQASLFSGIGQGFKYGDHYWLGRWHEDFAGNYGVQFVNLNILDVFPDPWEQRYYILRRFVTLAELGRISKVLSEPLFTKDETGEKIPVVDEKGRQVFKDGGVARKAFNRVEQAVKKGEVFGRWGWHYAHHRHTFPSDYNRYSRTDDAAVPSYVDGKDDPANVMISILEYHETANDGIVGAVIPDASVLTAGKREDLVWQRPGPHPYGKCQIVRWTPWPVDDEAFGYSLSEIAGDLADLHDFALRASARRTQRIADPAIKHRRSAKIAPIYLRSQSNVAIPVREMDDIDYMDPPAQADFHHLLHLLTKQTMDMGTGESEQRRGQVGGAGSATEAAIAEQAGSTSDFLVATNCFMAIEELADLTLRILRVHTAEKSEVLIPWLGARTAEMVRLTPEILDNQYWVTIGGSVLGGNPQIRGSNLLSIATQLAPTGVLDMNTIAEFALNEAGFNADMFLLQKKGPIPVDPELEHDMLFVQRPPMHLKVSPQDDHQAHIQSHFAEMQVRMQEQLTDPALLRELYQHAVEHQNALILQQQAMAQRAQGNGAENFQPSQAGQPGQPATFNERTANMNQQRQAPNVGQAPQPAVAPGRIGVL